MNQWFHSKKIFFWDFHDRLRISEKFKSKNIMVIASPMPYIQDLNQDNGYAWWIDKKTNASCDGDRFNKIKSAMNMCNCVWWSLTYDEVNIIGPEQLWKAQYKQSRTAMTCHSAQKHIFKARL